MTTDSGTSKLRFGLRAKLILLSLGLAFAPLIAIWPVGLIEDFLRREIAWEIDQCVDDLYEEGARYGFGVSRSNASGIDIDADADTDADANADERDAETWLHRFAEEHHVMIRILDEQGQVVLRTSPRQAERWANVRDVWQGLDDIFYGPTGPPDLLAYEARQSSEGSRPEVVDALAGHRSAQWRYDSEARMFVYSAAAPLPRGGAVYVTRISRRVIRSLYDMRYQLLKLTLFLAVAAVLFGLYVGRRMVAPLIKIERAIESYLAHPQKAALQSLALKRNDEIGDLSRSFHELTSRLHRQVEETASVAGDLAHDLKSPIATVTATAELLESSTSLTPERQARLADALTNAARHMRLSVDGLLDLARLDERLTSTEHSPVDLTALIRRVVDEAQATPQFEKFELSLDIVDEGLTIVGVESQMELLIRNMLDNALAFCASSVHIALTERSDTLHLTICDDGPGVSEGNREKIFRRFFSSRPEGTPPGTGLGLSIVSTIARAHGGTVELLSTSDDRPLDGACFRVTFPTM